MLDINRVLFPTDGSACAENAWSYAAYIADQFDAQLHIIRVDERTPEWEDVIEVKEADLLEELHAPIETDRVPPPQRQEHAVVHSDAAHGIVAYVTEHDMDLVVLGTHGRRGVRRAMLGSVAENVVRHAPCPVLTVGRGPQMEPDKAFDRALVPVDFSDHQEQLLETVRDWALLFGTEVSLLHVVQLESLPAEYGIEIGHSDPQEVIQRVQSALETDAAELHEAGVSADVEVRNGFPVDEILEAVESREAGFLAIATHGRTGLQRMMMGSVAEKVIRRASCPVLTVKSFGAPPTDGLD